MRRRDRRNAFGDEEAETVSDSRIEVGRRVRSWAEYKGLGKRERGVRRRRRRWWWEESRGRVGERQECSDGGRDCG